MGNPQHGLRDALYRVVGRQLARLRNLRQSFPHELAVCTIFKDEARDLEEWLTFHHGVGVDHFYLYNNNSSDAFLKVLEPWQRRCVISLIDWPEAGGQLTAYNDCLRRFRLQARWIAFIDIDEFLFSPKSQNLKDVLRLYADVPAIFVYWILFGSSGHATRPAGGILESYRRCLDLASARQDTFDHRKEPGMTHYVTGWAKDGKSIVNPRLVRWFVVHKPKELWIGETLDENRRPPRQRQPDAALSCEVFRINHYWSKSIEELVTKVERGSVNFANAPRQDVNNWLQRERELNKTEDTTILPLWRSIQAQAKDR